MLLYKYSKKHLKVREADASKQERKARLDSSLDSDDYCLDSSLDINPKDNSEDEEATIAKDLAREQKERLKALLNAKIRDSLSARVETAIEYCTLEEIFASVIGMTRTRAINKVVAIDPANSTLCDLSDLLVVVEMQTNTATALANKLAAVNKLRYSTANNYAQRHPLGSV
ncbi:hypothetical protein HBI89_203950 [Parastagonospora nodorum]|nr:hypothetical protein HBI97_128260 [Parastagonospora nodorum]KAH5893849.1 hypothetical protein HBI89_203950 [Parastagonospora nodorum]